LREKKDGGVTLSNEGQGTLFAQILIAAVQAEDNAHVLGPVSGRPHEERATQAHKSREEQRDGYKDKTANPPTLARSARMLCISPNHTPTGVPQLRQENTLHVGSEALPARLAAQTW
jgi:hypothetical protein